MTQLKYCVKYHHTSVASLRQRVAGFNRNKWPLSIGIDGRIQRNKQHIFFLKNFGNFPAFDVKIEDLKIEANIRNISPKTVKFVFHEFDIVPPGEKIPVVFRIENERGETGEELKDLYEPHLFQGYAVYDFEIPITYENILGIKYQALLTWGKSGANMGKPNRIR